VLRGTVGTEVKGLHHESTWEPRANPAMVTGCHRYFSKTPGYLWRYQIISGRLSRKITGDFELKIQVWSYKSWSGDAGTNLPQTSECKKSWEI
jgi:hypothetical protein